MKKIKFTLVLGLVAGLSACATFSGDPHPGKAERVGMLLADNCAPAGCDFSLLEEDMETPTTRLTGNIDATLAGRLIAVLGELQPAGAGLPTLRVERHYSITSFDYRPFFERAVPAYIQREYGCVSLWDQGYAWRLDGRQPVLIASLSNPLYPDQQLRLEFDGLSQAFMSRSGADDLDLCRLR